MQIFVWETLNCYIIETVGDFDLIPMMGLHTAKLWLASLRKFQKQPLGLDCEESCFYQTKKHMCFIGHWLPNYLKMPGH